MNHGIFLNLSFQDLLNRVFASVVAQYGDGFRAVSRFVLNWFLLPMDLAIRSIPPAVAIALVLVISWLLTRNKVAAISFALGTYLIGCLGLWNQLTATFSVLVLSMIVTIIIGIPIGVLVSRSNSVRHVVRPVLDVMQTMPSFVYLVPVLMLFGLGKVPAVLATVIYALPPLIRLTDLGLRSVEAEIVEAGQAFGCTSFQLLTRVQFPLALPSVMAGVNQAVMMALAMVVIASMIGAPGLGEEVLSSINNLDIGKGAQGGLAIVILAIIVDRVTQAAGLSRRERLVRYTRG
jgi:ABC-type proline/glycine betaine transport system permease subunit